MMLKPALATLILTGALAALPAIAQDAGTAPSADTVVATVNGEAITLGQMIAMKEGLAQDATANLPDTALWDLMLDQMVRQTAVGQLKANSLTARDKAAMEIDRRAYLAGAALEDVAAADPTEEELRAAYDTHFGANATPATEYNAAHILVATEDEAKAIADELAKGGDFAKLAEEKSTDNSSANKGDLGWFQLDMMVPPFSEAVKALKPGEVSAPVQTQFGWHVIKLNETREVTPPKFEEIKDQLAVQIRRERVDALIQKTTSDAKIEKTEGIDHALISKTDLLEK